MLRAAFILTGYTLTCFSFRRMLGATKPARLNSVIRIAPSWWKEIPADVGSIAPDTWGKLTSHETVGTSVNVELNDAAGRRVKVRGLRMRPGLSDLKVGAEIYIFGLERTGSGRGWNGRPFQPHAFHEIGADPQSRSDWTTTVFLGRAS